MSHQKLNYRNTIRRSISIPVTCAINNKIFDTSTIDISESGISVSLDELIDPGTELSIHLKYDNWNETTGRVTRNIFSNISKKTITGIRFASLELNNLLIIRQLLQLPLTINQLNYNEFPYNLNLNNQNHKLISKPSDIAHIFHTVFHNKTYLHIKQDQNNTNIESTITSINNESFTLSIVHEKNYCMDHNFDKLIIYFYHHGSYCIFDTLIISEDDNSFRLALPEVIIRLWRRPHPESRVKLAGNAEITIADHNSSVSFPLIDLGYEGFSLKLGDSDRIYAIGYSPVRVNLPLMDKTISCTAVLKYFDEHKYEEGYRCGFEITEISPENKNILYEFILRQKYPQLMHFDDASLDDIWQVFYQSGYMIPEKVEHVKKTMDEINNTWAKLYNKNSDIGIMGLFKENEIIYGCISVAQAYDNTWIVHQLAAIKHPTIFIGKLLLYYIYQVVIKHLDLEYFKTYFRNDNGWSLQTFLDFRNFCSNKEATHYEYKDLYEKDLVDFAERDHQAAGISIEELKDEQDINFIVDHLGKELPEIIIKAENLYKETLFLKKTKEKYIKNKLYRERRFILAKKNNEIIAFTLLEVGSTGINLGGLLDIFYFFTVKPNSENIEESLKQLIDTTCSIYKSYGKKTALCLTNKTDQSFLNSIGFKMKIEYIIWHLNREYIIQLIYHLNDFYYNKEKKKRRLSA